MLFRSAYAQESRTFFDNLWVTQNAARRARGQELIPYVENYRPWVIERNLWSRLGFRRPRAPEALLAERPAMPDFMKPSKAFNPRAEARTGGLAGYEKIRDLERLTLDYIETARKDVFYTDILQNGRAHTRALHEMGFSNSAAGLDSWLSEAFAGRDPLITRVVKMMDPKLGPGGFVGRRGVLVVRRQLTRAVFPLNFIWNIFVQTSSMVPTVARYGARYTFRGLGYLVRPSIRREIREQAYSVIIKRRRGGRVTYQDVSSGLERHATLERSRIDTVVDWANFLTSAIEDNQIGRAHV